MSIEPIPITWVRVEAGEGSGDAGSGAAPVSPSAVTQPAPPDRPAKQPPARERRLVRPAPAAPPSPAPATAREEIAAPAEQAPGPGEAAAEGEGPAADTVAAGSEKGERGAGAGSGVGHDGPAGAPAGWMPRGGEQPRPSYPDAARRRGVEGTAHVALRLALTGRVDSVRLHRSAGDAQLDGAALAAVKRWRFDAPPPGADWSGLWFVVPIEFRLR